MRIIFAGTPAFAAAHLEALLQDGVHQVVAIYTQPDRRAGRGKKMHPSPVKSLALKAGIPVQQPATLKDPTQQQQLAAYNADIMVVVAYGMLLPAEVLAIPRLGCINVHASLLPRWRGAAPIERAIAQGDSETGVTIMQMDVGLDTGDMLRKAACCIESNDTGDSLREKLIGLGTPALLKTLRDINAANTAPEIQHDADSNYAKKLNKAEAQINWREPASQIERSIRAFFSAMPCFALLDDQRIRIHSAFIVSLDKSSGSAPGEIIQVNNNGVTVQCGEGQLALETVQLPGAKAMSIQALRNGKPTFFSLGQQFTSPDTAAAN